MEATHRKGQNGSPIYDDFVKLDSPSLGALIDFLAGNTEVSGHLKEAVLMFDQMQLRSQVLQTI